MGLGDLTANHRSDLRQGIAGNQPPKTVLCPAGDLSGIDAVDSGDDLGRRDSVQPTVGHDGFANVDRRTDSHFLYRVVSVHRAAGRRGHHAEYFDQRRDLPQNPRGSDDHADHSGTNCTGQAVEPFVATLAFVGDQLAGPGDCAGVWGHTVGIFDFGVVDHAVFGAFCRGDDDAVVHLLPKGLCCDYLERVDDGELVCPDSFFGGDYLYSGRGGGRGFYDPGIVESVSLSGNQYLYDVRAARGSGHDDGPHRMVSVD